MPGFPVQWDDPRGARPVELQPHRAWWRPHRIDNAARLSTYRAGSTTARARVLRISCMSLLRSPEAILVDDTAGIMFQHEGWHPAAPCLEEHVGHSLHNAVFTDATACAINWPSAAWEQGGDGLDWVPLPRRPPPLQPASARDRHGEGLPPCGSAPQVPRAPLPRMQAAVCNERASHPEERLDPHP